MVPTGPLYFIFLALVFFVYWAGAGSRVLRLSLLLFANYFFLARFGLCYILLLPAAGLCDFLIALALGRLQSKPVRLALVSLSVALNVGLIVAVKFAAPLLVARFTPAQASIWTLTLPLGLSFYAFQALTYTLDVYRGDAKPTSSVLEHFAAVSFFPTLLAGPITRVSSLVTQFRRSASLTPEDGSKALFLIFLGLLKKLLIADYLAENLVNRVFDIPKLYSGLEVLAAVYGYALQLYYDFSGYSDVALGSALLLGFRVPVNFNKPYSALDLPDFWRRWHRSFSDWLRDYIYFSLPGKRSRFFQHFNLVITMLLGGLWHGLTWNFAVWGLLHGTCLAFTRLWQTWRGTARTPRGPAGKAARALLTAHFVCFTWIFFRAPSLDGALDILRQIGSFTISAGNLTPALLCIMALAIAGHFVPDQWFAKYGEWFGRAPFYAQAAAMLAVVLAIQAFSGKGSAPFVYSRF